MTRFQWENLEHFISLVNLLSLCNDGQLQPGKKRITKTSTSVGTTRLLGKASKTNSSDIFWTGLRRSCRETAAGNTFVAQHSSARHPGEGGKAPSLVTRNHGFQKRGVIFCCKLERLLADISASGQEETHSTRPLSCPTNLRLML
ncbi:hypothetical protein M404DRAFT_822624 [Pisolithus tinctorius Marx 270]|uniref:Uncharacterized protein n=1 Tax=Pisolithus tinctorius Marx 270 TaxID=870435 RepID=A0A0C3IPY5_PISTI|nr:hypothetical protein M404DRAFT_822624 [Pisolithus tinctorius Marx 270]